MKEKNHFDEDVLDIKKLIVIFWKEKFLILSIIFVCTISGYLYQNNQVNNKYLTKQNRYEFLINDISPIAFYTYTKQLNVSYDFSIQFKNILQLNLLSADNFSSFVEQSNDFDTIKAFLKSSNSIKKYHFVNFGQVSNEKKNIIENRYFLVLPENINEKDFINNYLQFTKKKTIIEIKKIVKKIIEEEVIIHQNLYEKAKILNINDMILAQQDFKRSDSASKIYMGSKYLSLEIDSLKLLLSKLENDSMDYAILLDISHSSNVKLNSNSTIPYSFAAFTFGLFLSLMIIGLKNILKYK